MASRVIGVGQRAGGDDGAGPAVIALLREADLPPDIELMEVNEPSALLPLLENAERVVIVDAALGAGAPGEVLVLRPEDIDQAAIAPVSTHGMSVGQAIELARVLSPETVCAHIVLVAIAAERPKGIRYGLSDEVHRALPSAAQRARSLVLGKE